MVQSLYSQQYVEAVALFRAGAPDECIELAEHNLTNPTLPRYHQMKNLILIAGAEADWYAAERCRRRTEDIWHYVTQRTPEGDEEGDEENQAEDAPEQIDRSLMNPYADAGEDDEEEHDDESRLEELDEVRKAEEELWGPIGGGDVIGGLQRSWGRMEQGAGLSDTERTPAMTGAAPAEDLMAALEETMVFEGGQESMGAGEDVGGSVDTGQVEQAAEEVAAVPPPGVVAVSQQEGLYVAEDKPEKSQEQQSTLEESNEADVVVAAGPGLSLTYHCPARHHCLCGAGSDEGA
ncbi:hypothetical protein LTR65_006481 [Meristemomyces frigidus]